jgi:hypothetical protein
MGLKPAEFWALSLGEWRALVEARFPKPPALARPDFENLMRLYPDTSHV